MTTPVEVDYVVVGSGSAGAVVAARLSEDLSTTVAILEAGPEDTNQFIHIPAAFSKLYRTDVDWDYSTTPQPQLGGRQIYWPRGKTLGGCSSMNAMMWVRGYAADYDEWSTHAGHDWSFQKVLPYFQRIENVQNGRSPGDGKSGPIVVSEQRSPRALTGDFLTAVQECGFKIERANTPHPSGFSQTMVTQKRGARWSTADAYLRPAAKRSNLTVLTNAYATSVTFDGTRAQGVAFARDGQLTHIRARREVILCGGAINTPHLLMLSGIGSAQHLVEHGIAVVHDAPEVGQNLQDHLVAGIVYSVEKGSLLSAESPPELVNYLVRRRGMLTSPVAEAYGFVHSRAGLEHADIELLFGPGPFIREGLVQPDGHGAVLGSVLLKPKSSGDITLVTPDPFDKPRIDPKYLSDPGGVDRAAMIAGLRTCTELAASPALARHFGDYLQPPAPADAPVDELIEICLEQYAHTLYHPVGTCRMGMDKNSVVDPQLRVRGVSGLRVADASVMPTIIRGHTHAPSVLIGEKAADYIKSH
ncbi:GMC family oxidoreductase N-terminal domain-containing protein [Hoyosella rhizosphaerae]|uniref:GMC-type oxidoreductase n=1 Tax=Hoyosella rhizosphaerae TaxID=1755582 RepID=A0A916U2F5_9ACTN|nr:GMC family oxidoreductase N-terminal domain-containing protein [Hoyosella rhizosphaerae]MBN4926623.1 GMC family oxidoreductase N-terminal domain-containing protein [Hoyosella rhizosphaerae]GGC57815.1 putative GMC-type oxidoreductase [Hoyosella rhizosphaerae]